MNRRAVALAADSAATITFFERGERKQRYFKGTNKIFNLSYMHPIALMTYDSGNLRGVPWETIAKAYREHLKSATRDHVSEYTDDFFKFIENNRDLYTEGFLDKQLLADITENAGFVLYLMDEGHKANEESDVEKKKKIMVAGFEKIRPEVDNLDYIVGCSDEDVEAIIAKHKDKIIEAFKNDSYIMSRADVLDLEAVALLAIKALLKRTSTILETSGLVITGFGEKEYFPVLQHFTCYGFVLGKLICVEKEVNQINQENVTEVLPFAQSEMSKAFMYGAQPSVLKHVNASLVKALDNFENMLRKEGHIAKEIDCEKIKNDTQNKFGSEVAVELMNTHTNPMKRVVGVLPIDELAELAEILVRMESLKERVTRDTESVSGPIDVAVISKHDGFIWIKRKHYFDPKLNPRFFIKEGISPHA